MSKLSKRERDNIERQMSKPAERGNTWVGLCPKVFKDKRHDIKSIRREGKALCKNSGE